jgi:hypothetical protein
VLLAVGAKICQVDDGGGVEMALHTYVNDVECLGQSVRLLSSVETVESSSPGTVLADSRIVSTGIRP